MHIVKISDDKDLDIIVSLAHTVWHEYFTPIIGKEQVEYMLEKFQSKQSLRQQLQNGFTYFLLINHAQPIGYIGIQLKNNELFLSKFYLLLEQRRKGFGRQAMDFLEQFALKQHAKKITLTVNKNNLDTINAYTKMGFINLGSVIQNIGHKFVMDDYEMEKFL